MIKNSSFVIVNDKLIRREEVKFSIDSRAVRYGDGFFESMRAFGLEVPLFGYHYQRIEKAWQIMMFDSLLPDKKVFVNAIARLLKSNKHFGSARLRLSFFRSGEGKYLPETNNVEWYLESFASEEKEFLLNTKGKLIDVYDMMFKPVHPFFSIKSNHSQIYTLASLWAKNNNLDDAFIVNDKGMIVEATSSNAFLLYGSELYTPPLTDGCVEGVMRAFLLKELLPKMGVSCREISFNTEILEKADEMFITNAVQGIQWVVGYKNRRFFNKRSKLLSVALNEACLIK